MELEKEVRFSVSDDVWQKALSISQKYSANIEMLDIVMGAYGRESVSKTGRGFRIRQKPNEITLEVKNKIDGGWQEESIAIDSISRGINFLTLAGLSPYMFVQRYREICLYKGLKIFFDDVKLLGKYIEIEYQDSLNAAQELEEFCTNCGITSSPQPLYGDIINNKYDTDPVFRQAFDDYLNELINNN